MADIIQLLPDSIANQIAAGEVIQRPAAVVKELLENAIDAQGKCIKLVIKDSGKTLIQVIDDGIGMSDTDARMAFERHATSKIAQASDLFKIQTKGFRGEALASIVAIAHVELITCQSHETLGRKLVIHGSEVKKHEACQSKVGSTFSVKNLFYNVPARRKFLKSDAVELRYIVEEFKRVALAHPEVAFEMHHNDNEVYILPAGKLKQRIVNIFGKASNEKLIPITETVDNVQVSGYVGKPEAAKKTKGDQYFFVNNRYIKSNYLNHAVKSAFEQLISKEQHPLYVIYLDIDPEDIDINVHPTKTEIKFENERLIYNYIKVAVRHALGQYSISPRLDFPTDTNFSQGHVKKDFLGVEKEYNFDNQEDKPRPQAGASNAWKQIYDTVNKNRIQAPAPVDMDLFALPQENEKDARISVDNDPYQVLLSYILVPSESGYMLIDQQAAHERIIYERCKKQLSASKSCNIQKVLFPRMLHLDKGRFDVMCDIVEKINHLGFEIEAFGGESFVIHGTPTDLPAGINEVEVLEQLLDDYLSQLDMETPSTEKISRAMAYSSAIRREKKLSVTEMKELVEQLFACELPSRSPLGRKCYVQVSHEEVFALFE